MKAKVSAPIPVSAANRMVSRREQATHSGGCDLRALEPGGAFGGRVDEEATELGLRTRLARAELDASAREQVQRGHPLGGARRMVVAGRRLNDAVPETDVLRALADRPEKHLGGGRVAVLLQEVVLHLPDDVEPEPVGQLDLLECVLQEPVLVVLRPRTGQLVFVEDAELHASPSAL